MAIHRTDAIVLRAIDYSETSLIVWLYTRDHGRVHLIAKGARRARSPFEGALEPLVRGELVFYRKAKPDGLDIAKEFDPVDLHLGLRADLARLHRGVYVGELLTELSEPDVASPEAFDAAAEALGHLARGSHDALEQALVGCQLRLLAASGLRPVLDRCARCGGPVFPEAPAGRDARPAQERDRRADDAWFGPAQGGALCLEHGRGESGATAVSRPLLRRLLATALGRRVAPDPAADLEVRRLLDQFLAWHLGREGRMVRWLRPVTEQARPEAGGAGTRRRGASTSAPRGPVDRRPEALAGSPSRSPSPAAPGGSTVRPPLGRRAR
ncbi:MAG: DNA repair protein RecO [Planctomycetes bacterium]|nr:DNA repair protein RecO [Planctomycetota bacterium]